jgi:hypothetical protein
MTGIVTKLWGFCHTLRHDEIDRDRVATVSGLLTVGSSIVRTEREKPTQEWSPRRHRGYDLLIVKTLDEAM